MGPQDGGQGQPRMRGAPHMLLRGDSHAVLKVIWSDRLIDSKC